MKYPIFLQYALGYRKIEDEETYIAVDDDRLELGIIRMCKVRNCVGTMVKNGTKVSEAAFNDAFKNALTKLNIMLLDEIIPDTAENPLKKEETEYEWATKMADRINKFGEEQSKITEKGN